MQNQIYEFSALDTSEPVNCCELDGNKAGGYKQRSRQNRWKEWQADRKKWKRTKNNTATTIYTKSYNIYARDAFSENLLKQYFTCHW